MLSTVLCRRVYPIILARGSFPFPADVVEQQGEETTKAILRVGAGVEVDGDGAELGDGAPTVL